jgi:hypothetical protein
MITFSDVRLTFHLALIRNLSLGFRVFLPSQYTPQLWRVSVEFGFACFALHVGFSRKDTKRFSFHNGWRPANWYP